MITEREINRRRWLVRLLIVLAVLPALIWGFVPKEPVVTAQTFDPASLGDAPVANFVARDADTPGITPGAERSVVWAGDEGMRSDIVLVYLHGFSATAQEIRPVPERVAENLGANLVFMRLTGHGRDGAALATATVENWMHDVDESLAVARAMGDRVVVIGTSTGGTLAAMAAATGREIDGIVFISPNFGISSGAAFLLTLPGVRHWGPPLFGRTRSWEPVNEAQALYWTESYPTEALFPMAALVEATVLLDHRAIATPALFYFSDEDQVVDSRKTHGIAAAWGGPA